MSGECSAARSLDCKHDVLVVFQFHARPKPPKNLSLRLCHSPLSPADTTQGQLQSPVPRHPRPHVVVPNYSGCQRCLVLPPADTISLPRSNPWGRLRHSHNIQGEIMLRSRIALFGSPSETSRQRQRRNLGLRRRRHKPSVQNQKSFPDHSEVPTRDTGSSRSSLKRRSSASESASDLSGMRGASVREGEIGLFGN